MQPRVKEIGDAQDETPMPRSQPVSGQEINGYRTGGEEETVKKKKGEDVMGES
jgi:hypothetical protein